MHICSGKLTLLDIGNNSFSAKGAFHVGGYVKKTKSLLWLNVYMNDIGDEVQYFQVVNHFCRTLMRTRTFIWFPVHWLKSLNIEYLGFLYVKLD